jgi:hypothetical protein
MQRQTISREVMCEIVALNRGGGPILTGDAAMRWIQCIARWKPERRRRQSGDQFVERESVESLSLFGRELPTLGLRPSNQLIASVSHPPRVGVSSLLQERLRLAFDQAD